MVAEILTQDEINALLDQAGGVETSGDDSGGLDSYSEPAAAPSTGAPNTRTAPPPSGSSYDPPPPPPAEDYAGRIAMFKDIEMKVSAEVGRNIFPLKEVLKIGPNSVVELDKIIDDDVDILVNGQKIAEGEVVIIDDHFGVKIKRFLNDDEIIAFINKYRRN
jgi:flagellar motor switch protein FliN